MAIEGVSTKAIWAGRIISGLTVAFLLMDGVMKLFKLAFVVDATVKLGFPESTIVGIGISLLLGTILYAIPRTAVLGAVWLTGYLGGAVCSQVRISAGIGSIAFPFVFCVLVWLGLWLRDSRVRGLLP